MSVHFIVLHLQAVFLVQTTKVRQYSCLSRVCICNHKHQFSTDILRRVSIVIRQHILKCEERLRFATSDTSETGLFHMSKMKLFDEDNYLKPQYAYRFQHMPLAHMGMHYSIIRLESPSSIPEVTEIYAFCRDLFIKAQLSAECSIGI